ncbi:MAG: hypothetical protein QXV37_02380, partial [Candidatus Jordarchaeaceae archaeon]
MYLLESIPKSYILVFVQKRKEFNSEVLLIKGNPKLRRIKPDLRLWVEFYQPRENLLRPNRVSIFSNGRNTYIQPKEFTYILRNSRRIVIVSDFKEELKTKILDMLRDFSI